MSKKAVRFTDTQDFISIPISFQQQFVWSVHQGVNLLKWNVSNYFCCILSTHRILPQLSSWFLFNWNVMIDLELISTMFQPNEPFSQKLLTMVAPSDLAGYWIQISCCWKFSKQRPTWSWNYSYVQFVKHPYITKTVVQSSESVNFPAKSEAIFEAGLSVKHGTFQIPSLTGVKEVWFFI